MSGDARFSALAQPGIRTLRAYDPGHDLVAMRRRIGPGLVELGSNENAYGCSARVADAIAAALPELYRYPDPLGGDLKQALAQRLGVQPSNLLLGNGSHELLMQFAQVFAGPGCDVVASQYGFAVYAIAAHAAGAALRLAAAHPIDHAMPRGHDLAALAAAITPTTRIVYLANPNNPTGTWFARTDLEAFLRGVPADVLVVVDEAYHEYVTQPGIGSAAALLPQFDNLIVTRTFSKAYGLAALRIGYAIADAGLIAVMERVRESFNVNLLGLAAAVAALGDEAHVADVRARNAAERDRLADALRARGWKVGPSATNFLLVEFGARTSAIEAQLLEAGVVLRPMGGYGLGECLRITVATPAENARLLAALDAIAGA